MKEQIISPIWEQTVSDRLISFDTETTGLVQKPGGGFEVGDHRVIEIGCVEILGRERTGKEFQTYVNPEGRLIEEKAKKVTGISDEEVKTAPKFEDIVDEFISFVHGAELIAHNANFDVEFINSELKRIKYKITDIRDICSVFDTWVYAKKAFPGQKNSLDALSKRLDVTGYDRTYHGALLDAQILADTYLGLTGGQITFDLAQTETNQKKDNIHTESRDIEFSKFSASADDLSMHEKFLKILSKKTEKEINW